MPYAVARLLNADADSQQDYNLVPYLTLNEGTFEAFRDASLTITKFLNTNLLALVRNDLKFHRVVLADLAEGYDKDDEYPNRRAVAIHQMALASLLNFSVGVGLYQEHSENRAGQNGDNFREHVHQVFRDEYDQCPDLLLMRRLRNVAVHSTLELVSVVHGTRVQGDDLSDAQKYSSIRLNVENLLAHDRISKKLKDHLRSLGPEVEVADVMERALTDLRRIDQAILLYCHPALLTQCRVVLAFREGIRAESEGDLMGVVVVAYDEQTGEQLTNAEGHFQWHGLEDGSDVERFAIQLVEAASAAAR